MRVEDRPFYLRFLWDLSKARGQPASCTLQEETDLERCQRGAKFGPISTSLSCVCAHEQLLLLLRG